MGIVVMGYCIVYVVDYVELVVIVQVQHIKNTKIVIPYTVNYECR